MTLRIVQIRFNEGEEHRVMETMEEAERVFPTIPGVTGFQCGPAAEDNDQHHLVLLVEFDALEDVEPYRVHNIHESFANDYLRPYATITAVNYEL